MSKKNSPIKIAKSDFARVVLTETSPTEVPLIFSNEGFYKNLKFITENKSGLSKIFLELLFKKGWAKPLKYKISKEGLSPRTLWLLHPKSQREISIFYSKNCHLLAYYASLSEPSIRAPYKVAGTLFKKDRNQALSKYRSQNNDDTGDDTSSRYPKSFFVYRGYRRIYRFFVSSDFQALEKKYSHMWGLDVGRCFDSIYTHSITWALKNKQFAKQFIRAKTFGDEFDQLMQCSNNGETSGIPIGPESSRIFAEIILQRIDRDVIAGAAAIGLRHGSDFELRRYVDDYFVFSNDEGVSKKIFGQIDHVASEYNLRLNERKTLKLIRPFQTSKSRVISESKHLLNDFMESISVRTGDKIFPKKIFSAEKARTNFLNRLKTALVSVGSSYELSAPYLVGAFNKRVLEFVESFHSLNDEEKFDSEELYFDSLRLILEIMFFLFSMCPIHSTSAALSESIILTLRFFKKNYSIKFGQISFEIFHHTGEFFSNQALRDGDAEVGYTRIEEINLLLALGEVSKDYAFSEVDLQSMFKMNVPDRSMNYFEIVSLLYYLKNVPAYFSTRMKVVRQIHEKLRNLSDFSRNAEIAFLLLDVLACPLLSRFARRKYLGLLYFKTTGTVPNIAQLDSEISFIEENPWFVDWDEIDLIAIIQRRQLQAMY